MAGRLNGAIPVLRLQLRSLSPAAPHMVTTRCAEPMAAVPDVTEANRPPIVAALPGPTGLGEPLDLDLGCEPRSQVRPAPVNPSAQRTGSLSCHRCPLSPVGGLDVPVRPGPADEPAAGKAEAPRPRKIRGPPTPRRTLAEPAQPEPVEPWSAGPRLTRANRATPSRNAPCRAPSSPDSTRPTRRDPKRPPTPCRTRPELAPPSLNPPHQSQPRLASARLAPHPLPTLSRPNPLEAANNHPETTMPTTVLNRPPRALRHNRATGAPL
jgi:hypothetical protein